jgi:Cu-Zn family superoxide dismutase
MTHRHTLATAVFLLALIAGATTALAASRPETYLLPGDDVFPEGITFQEASGFFYVSSTTDGTIFRGHVDDPTAEVFLPGGADGRTTAVGLEVDRLARLFVAGGASDQVFVYDTRSSELLAALAVDGGFINDVAVTRAGDAYFTDSLVPLLYRVSQTAGTYTLEPWLDFTGTPLEFQDGFNVNGIVATPDDRYLIVVQSNTGKLFRITIATREVVEIDLGGAALTNGDGLVLQGNTLYVVRNALEEIAVVRLTQQYIQGQVVGTITDPSFDFPTTAALARGRLLVVNSQFDELESGADGPFTVSSIKPHR